MAQEKTEIITLTEKGREKFLEDLKNLERNILEKFQSKQKILKVYKEHDHIFTKVNALIATLSSAYILYGFYYAKHIRRFPFTFQLFWLYVTYRAYKFSFIYILGYTITIENIIN